VILSHFVRIVDLSCALYWGRNVSQFRYKLFCYHITVWRSVMPCFVADSNHNFGETCSPLHILPWTSQHENWRFSPESYLPKYTASRFSRLYCYHLPQLGPQNSWCYMLRLQICTFTTKGRAVLTGCCYWRWSSSRGSISPRKVLTHIFYHSYLLYWLVTNRQHTVRVKVIRN
jgi:hypothetical protein